MSPVHSLTILLCLVPFALAGGSVTPDDFNEMCRSQYEGELSPFELANLDLYDDLSTVTSTVVLMGWNAVDNGMCDNSLIACSNFTAGANNVDNELTVSGIVEDFYNEIDVANTPIFVETTFVCADCPDCALEIVVGNDVANDAYSCESTERTERLDYPSGNHTIFYTAVFNSNTTVTGCVTITRYRVFQVPDCSSGTFNLGVYPASGFGDEAVDVQCVDNAVGQVMATCNASSEWELVGSGVCECQAGFEPKANLTACASCADGFFKSGTGNAMCEECLTNQVSIADRTNCVCVANHIGDNCDQCIMNYFMPGGQCVECPAGSVRDTNEAVNSCSCTGNTVTSSGSNTTDSPSVPCDDCLENYFMSGVLQCMECPSGSVRATEEDLNSCTCTGNLVTSSTNSPTTNSSPCDDCAEGYYRASDEVPSAPCPLCDQNYFMMPGGSACMECPSGSERDKEDPQQGVCRCSGQLVTSEGRNSTSDVTVPCGTVIVKFYAPIFTVREGDNIMLSVAVTSPPSEDITIRFNRMSHPGTTATAILTESTLNVSVNIPVPDNSVALEETRDFIVQLSTDDKAVLPENMAKFKVLDNDMVQAAFAQTSYSAGEGDTLTDVCVTLSTEVAVDVQVRVTGEMLTSSPSPSASGLGELDELLLFIAGESTEACLPEFDVADDSDEEDDEQYRLSLEIVSPANNDDVTVGDNALVFIEDDDDSSGTSIGLVIGVCSGGAALAVIAAIACIICLCCWKVKVKQQGFYHTNEDSQAPPTMLHYSVSLRSITSQSVVATEGKRATAKENEFLV